MRLKCYKMLNSKEKSFIYRKCASYTLLRLIPGAVSTCKWIKTHLFCGRAPKGFTRGVSEVYQVNRGRVRAGSTCQRNRERLWMSADFHRYMEELAVCTFCRYLLLLWCVQRSQSGLHVQVLFYSCFLQPLKLGGHEKNCLYVIKVWALTPENVFHHLLLQAFQDLLQGKLRTQHDPFTSRCTPGIF